MKSETLSVSLRDILTAQDVPQKFLPSKLGRVLKAHRAGVAIIKCTNAVIIAGRPSAVAVRLISKIYIASRRSARRCLCLPREAVVRFV